MKKNIIKTSLVLISLVMILSCILTVFSFADESLTDAMTDIKSALSDKQISETITIENDGYIGISIELTTYYDFASHGKAKAGYNGTPYVTYVVNTRTERIGALSDTEIISSMLERGYIVSVLDYKNDPRAISPDLDWSAQTVREDIYKGKYLFDTTVFEIGEYSTNFIVPAGYDVLENAVFWEIDKHAAEGTLEKIVENWNTDFRSCNKNTVIYWRYPNGERKPTQSAPDGTDPIWLDADGNEDPDGSYIKVIYTLAKDVTDCTGQNGEPLDLNLYMHVVYPTTSADAPIEPVPVMALASSGGYLSTSGTSTGLRPHHTGSLFRGYAGVVYDYLYQPMEQSDFYGYYDGRLTAGGVTDDQMSYSLFVYNDKRVNTAAMRYIRYLTLTEPEKYAFDVESIGVYGNSKGGWISFLGEAELRESTVSDTTAYTQDELEALIDERINSYASKRQYEGHNDETRYQAGKTDAYTLHGTTIDGGEKQPWTTYTDKDGIVHEILSFASWTYASNGSANEGITAGHSPVFSALHLLQEGYNTTNQTTGEISGTLDIPSFYFVVPLGHTLAYGKDHYHGVDVYEAMFDFANYYLQNAAVKVVYTDPANHTGSLETKTTFTVKFSGAIPKEEIKRITLSDGTSIVNGEWTATRGMTEWTFTPNLLKPDTDYTLTVPASIRGDNGQEMGSDYTASFHTKSEQQEHIDTIKTDTGTYFIIDRSLLNSSNAILRIRVDNDGANTLGVYEVCGFDPDHPNDAIVGDLVDTVGVNGAGYYDVDLSPALIDENAEFVFFVKAEKEAKSGVVFDAELGSSLSAIKQKNYVSASVSTAPDGTPAAKFYVKLDKRYGYDSYYYSNLTTAFSISDIFGSTDIAPEDLGRRYTVSFRIYDTDTRTVQIYLNGAFTDTNGVHDFNRVYLNVKTRANEWTEVSFDYTVYEPIYGSDALTPKTLTLAMESDGCNETPIYIDRITATETVTDVALNGSGSALILGRDGREMKQASSSLPFEINGRYYGTLGDALTIAGDGDTVTAHSSYVLTLEDALDSAKLPASLTLDLSGYKLYSKASSSSLIKVSALSDGGSFTVKNGDIYLSNDPLIDLYGASDGSEFDITLENVYITNGTNSSLSNVLCSTSEAKNVKVKLNLRECEIDIELSENSTNPITILYNGDGKTVVSYTITGSTISLDTLVNVTLWGKKNLVDLKKGSEGEYLTLTLPASVGGCSSTATREGDIVSFDVSSEKNYVSTYKTEVNPNATKYGIIPEEYLDAELYPFILFDKNENFIGAYSLFMSNDNENVLDAAKFHLNNGWDGSSYGDDPYESFILMRRDYTLQSEEKYNNLAQAQGTINIDLGGFTLSCGRRTIPILPGGNKGWNGARGEPIFPSTFIISNGTLLVNNRGAVTMRSNDNLGGGKIADKEMIFIYNNVTFAFDPTNNVASDCGLLAHFTDEAEGTYTASPYYTVYNDCTFDLSSVLPKYNVTLFNLNTDGYYIKHSVTVNGGKIITSDPSSVTVVKSGIDNYGSSISFGVGSDENYLAYSIPVGSTLSGAVYQTANGDMRFVKAESGKEYDTYTLEAVTVTDIVTDYGTIPTDFASASEYPFVLFCDGAFDKGYTTWAEAITAANAKMSAASKKDVKVVILMRRSYDCTSNDTFANLAQSAGKITLDLAGYTLTCGSKIFLNATAKANTYTTTVEIKNGKMIATSNAIVYTATGSTAPGVKSFDITFSGVTFELGASVGSNTAIVRSVASSAGNYVCGYNLSFDECIFDLSRYNGTTAVTLFNLSNSSEKDNEDVSVSINSGSIILPEKDIVTLFKTASNDSVTFTKTNGNYTSLSLPNGSKAPSGEYDIEGGKAVFVKIYEKAGYDVYRLRNAATVGIEFTPKASITLDNAITLNVYVPANNSLQKLVFNGTEYANSNLDTLSTREIDGTLYYAFNLPLASSDAAKTFTLKAYITNGETTAVASFSFSVISYAAKVLEDPGASAVEKELARDVLAYIRAAYEYFDKFNSKEEIARAVTLIDELIGDYEGTPISSGVTAQDKNGTVTKVTLNLDTKPTIRFFVNDTTLKFFINGAKLNTVTGIDETFGTYVELDAHAYALAETITYGDGGSYHVSSFLDGASGTNHERLAALFIKYTESAAAYRASVLSEKN